MNLVTWQNPPSSPTISLTVDDSACDPTVPVWVRVPLPSPFQPVLYAQYR